MHHSLDRQPRRNSRPVRRAGPPRHCLHERRKVKGWRSSGADGNNDGIPRSSAMIKKSVLYLTQSAPIDSRRFPPKAYLVQSLQRVSLKAENACQNPCVTI